MASTLSLTHAENPAMAEVIRRDWPALDWVAIGQSAHTVKSMPAYLEKRLGQRMAAARMGICVVLSLTYNPA